MIRDEKRGHEPEIEALEDFAWDSTEPQKLRPYKPKYNITMGRSQPYLTWISRFQISI